MTFSIRVSLPGYNALTDTNPDHFALKSDLNDILIKEYTRGTITVPGNTTIPITHNFNYVPFFIIYYKMTFSNYKIYAFGNGLYSYIETYSNLNQIFIKNKDSNLMTINYYIFYDNAI